MPHFDGKLQVLQLLSSLHEDCICEFAFRSWFGLTWSRNMSFAFCAGLIAFNSLLPGALLNDTLMTSFHRLKVIVPEGIFAHTQLAIMKCSLSAAGIKLYTVYVYLP